MASELIFQTALAPEWIDYNHHLRDAYYGLIVSYASDALMDRLGMDAGYRTRTGNTLYTVEMHIHYLREVGESDTVLVTVRLIGADHKRIHAAFDLTRTGDVNAAASAELMLLHVHQGEAVSSQPFPSEIGAAIKKLLEKTAGAPSPGTGSRRMELRSRLS